MDEAVAHIDLRLTPFKPSFIRDVTRDDILRLMEIKMGRILKFNTDKCNVTIAQYKEEIAKIDSPDVQTYLKAVLINGNRERIDRVVQSVLMGNKEPTKENIIERLVQNTNKMSGDEHGKDVVTYPEVRMEKWMNILRRRVVSGDGTVFDLGNINSFVECFKDELISALEDSGAFNAEYEINHKAFANLIVLKLLRNQAALTPEGKKAGKEIGRAHV